MKAPNILLSIFATMVFFLALSRPAHAYLDPVTGSLIVQGLVALIAGVVAGVKSIRVKLIQFLTRIFPRGDDQ